MMPVYAELVDAAQVPVARSLGFDVVEQTALFDVPVFIVVRLPVGA